MPYLCPVCKTELTEWVGTRMFPGHPDHGITLDCGNKDCTAQEVSGHGRNAKEANDVIQDKYVVRGERVK